MTQKMQINETNEKIITVSSVIEEVDGGLVIDSERCESRPRAKLKYSERAIIISYEEKSEGGLIETEITVGATDVCVKRHGAIESVFNFREGLVEKSVYSIPPYSFDAVVTTKKIRNNLTRLGGEVSIIYDIDIGGAKKRTRMKVVV